MERYRQSVSVSVRLERMTMSNDLYKTYRYEHGAGWVDASGEKQGGWFDRLDELKTFLRRKENEDQDIQKQ